MKNTLDKALCLNCLSELKGYSCPCGWSCEKRRTLRQMIDKPRDFKDKGYNDVNVEKLLSLVAASLRAEMFTREEVCRMIQMIYSEFAETESAMKTTAMLRHIIEQEVEQHPTKPIKIFK